MTCQPNGSPACGPNLSITRREQGLAIILMPSKEGCSDAGPFHAGNAAGDVHIAKPLELGVRAIAPPAPTPCDTCARAPLGVMSTVEMPSFCMPPATALSELGPLPPLLRRRCCRPGGLRTSLTNISRREDPDGLRIASGCRCS